MEKVLYCFASNVKLRMNAERPRRREGGGGGGGRMFVEYKKLFKTFVFVFLLRNERMREI